MESPSVLVILAGGFLDLVAVLSSITDDVVFLFVLCHRSLKHAGYVRQILPLAPLLSCHGDVSYTVAYCDRPVTCYPINGANFIIEFGIYLFPSIQFHKHAYTESAIQSATLHNDTLEHFT